MYIYIYSYQLTVVTNAAHGRVAKLIVALGVYAGIFFFLVFLLAANTYVA